ncbi:unnamed protein product, partial [Meganyctiphanes norvegica]
MDNALMYYGKEKEGKLEFGMTVNNKDYFSITPSKSPLELFTWIHFCHELSSMDKTYINGVIEFDLNWHEDRQPLNMSGILIIGQEQDSYGGHFDKTQGIRGYVAQFNIWSYILKPEEIRDMALGVKSINGDVFSSDYNAVELINVDMFQKPIKELLSEDSTFLMFPDYLVTFDEGISLCDSIGSSLYMPLSSLALNKLINILNMYDQIYEKLIWLGITDRFEENNWVMIKNNIRFTETMRQKLSQEMNFLNPILFDISEEENMNCAILVRGNLSLIRSRACTDRFGLTCTHNFLPLLALRGLCSKKTFKNKFIPTKHNNEIPFLQNLEGNLIITSNNNFQWLIIEVGSNKTLAITQEHDF